MQLLKNLLAITAALALAIVAAHVAAALILGVIAACLLY